MGCEIIIKKGDKEVMLTSLDIYNEEDFAEAIVQNGLNEDESSQIKELLAEEKPISIKVVKDGDITRTLPNYTIDQFIKQYELEEEPRIKALTQWLYSTGKTPRIYMTSTSLTDIDDRAIRGATISNKNMIILNGTLDKNAIVNTLVHELSHNLFDSSLSNPQKSQLTKLFKTALDEANKNNQTLKETVSSTMEYVRSRYKTTNDSDLFERELLTHLLENPEFFSYLKNKIDNYEMEDLVDSVNEVKFYRGDAKPGNNTIFVFGSNPQGRHGQGAALTARKQFGARVNQGRGRTGNAYALVTKNLEKGYTELSSNITYNEDGLKSVSREQIINNIKDLYKYANENPHLNFKIGYRNQLSDVSLNGYSGEEMIDMFIDAGKIPNNVYISEEWAQTGKFGEIPTSELEKRIGINIIEHDKGTNSATSYVERTARNARWSDVTLAIASDFTTRGEQRTAQEAGEKHIQLSIPGNIDLYLNDEQGYKLLISDSVNHIYSQIESKGLPKDKVKLNIAGNGIYSLNGLTQENVDRFVKDILDGLSKKINIKEVRSGGQTGVDEAGVKAARDLGIRASVVAPKNFLYRLENLDISDKKGFIDRFDKNAPKPKPRKKSEKSIDENEKDLEIVAQLIMVSQEEASLRQWFDINIQRGNTKDGFNKLIDELLENDFIKRDASGVLEYVREFGNKVFDEHNKNNGEISFADDQKTLEPEQLFPHLQYDKETKKFNNIKQAYDFFKKNYNENTVSLWSEPKKADNVFQIAKIKSGDVININQIQHLTKEQASKMGLTNGDHGLTMPYIEIAALMNNTTGSEAQMKARKAWLDKQAEYKDNYKNYIVARSFINNGKQMAVVAVEFGKGNVSNVYIDLNATSIKSFRSLDDSYKTKVQYNEDGTITVEQDQKSKYNIKDIPAGYLEIAQLALQNLAKVNQVELEAIDASKIPESLIKQTKGGFGEFFTATKHGISVTGNFQQMKQPMMDASAGDYIKYVSGRTTDKKPTFSWGTKIMNLPGGILILDAKGNVKSVNFNMVTQVIFSKEGSALNTVISDLNKGDLRSEVRNSKMEIPDYITQYPFWMNYKPTKDEAFDRVKAAGNLKRGDVVKVRFWSKRDNTYKDMLGNVVYSTGTKVYYSTESSEHPMGSVNPANVTTDKWHNTTAGFVYGTLQTNGQIVQTDNSKNSYLVGAYSDKSDLKNLYDYLTSFKGAIADRFNSNDKGLDMLRDAMKLDDLTKSLTGEILGNSGRMSLRKTSISAEWDITEFDGTNDYKVQKVSNLVPGDLIQTDFETEVDGKKEKHHYYGIFSHYDDKTGLPVVAMKRKSGSFFAKYVNFDEITAVGERILPIVKYTDKDGDHFANTKNLEGVEVIGEITVISEGRPKRLQKIQEILNEFISNGQKFAVMSKKQVDEYTKYSRQIFGQFATFSSIPVTRYYDSETKKEFFSVEKNLDATKPNLTKVNGEQMYFGKKGDKYIKQYMMDSLFTIGKNKVDSVNELFSGKNRKYDVFNVNKAGFVDAQSLLTDSDIVTMSVLGENYDKPFFVTGVVTLVSNSAIEVTYIKKGDVVDGEPTYIPKRVIWYKNDTNKYMIEASAQDLQKVREYGAKVKSKKYSPTEAYYKVLDKYQGDKNTDEKATPTIDFSKDMEFKTTDSLERIAIISSKLSDLYGADVNLFDNTQMEGLEREYGVTLNNAKAFAFQDKIYVNTDKASIADPLHELTHILLPGLKALSPELYNRMMELVKLHPDYDRIVSNYGDLANYNLDDEVFCTILGEFYRNKMINENAADWVTGEFMQITEGIPQVLQDIFDNDFQGQNVDDLMNYSLEQIMTAFGNSLVNGNLKNAYKAGSLIRAKTSYQSTYYRLLDSGNLIKLC